MPHHRARHTLRVSSSPALGRPAPDVRARRDRGSRDALQQGLHISSAISMAQEGLGADVHALLGALATFDKQRADRTMEAALALRSVERAIEDVLLRAFDEIAARQTVDSAAWALSARWGEQWLGTMRRLVGPPTQPVNILIGDASGGTLHRMRSTQARWNSSARPPARMSDVFPRTSCSAWPMPCDRILPASSSLRATA